MQPQHRATVKDHGNRKQGADSETLSQPPEPVHSVLTMDMRPRPARPLCFGQKHSQLGGLVGWVAQPVQRDRRASPRGPGLRADTADALSARFSIKWVTNGGIGWPGDVTYPLLCKDKGL